MKRIILQSIILCLFLPISAFAQSDRLIEWPRLNNTPMHADSVDLENLHFVQVSAGDAHSLALTDDGYVLPWGSNGLNRAIPPDDLSNVAQISAGYQHSLALLLDGTVVAWGNGSAINVPAEFRDPETANVKQVAAGSLYSLVLRNDGTLHTWGYQTNPGQGNAVPEEFSNPETAHVEQIAIRPHGTSRRLILRADHTVVALGPSTGEGQSLAVPEDLPEVVQVAVGQNHFLVLLADGSIRSWGLQTGPGQNNAVPPDLADPITANVVQIVASNNSSFALLSDGTVRGWGNQTNPGQMNAVPLELTDPATANVSAIVGSTHFLAVRDDGTFIGWGSNTQGQAHFVTIDYDRIDQIATGSSGHRVAINYDGTVVAWGSNGDGQIVVPEELTDPETANVVQVAAGNGNSFALKADGTALAWGRTTGPGQRYAIPEDLMNVRQLAVGLEFVLALLDDGTVRGWGGGGANVPEELTNPETAHVVQVSADDRNAGRVFGMALKADGTVRVWGTDGGVNDFPDDLEDVVQVSAGTWHGLALKADGTVRAWGNGPGGNTPAELTNPETANVVQVNAGSLTYAGVVRADGTIRMWGNGAGSNPPAGVTDVVQMSASNHTAVIIRRPGEPSPYLHLSVAPDTRQVVAGESVPFGLTFRDGDDLSVTDVPVDVRVYRNGNLILQDVIEGEDSETYTFDVPEDADFEDLFTVRFRAKHDDYPFTVGRLATVTLAPHLTNSITGNEGWRMLSAPLDGSTVHTLANANLVRGLPDEYPGGDLNLYVGYTGDNDVENPDRGFTAPSGLAHQLLPGRGFIWYLFNQNYNPPEANGYSRSVAMPFDLSFFGSPLVETYQVTFTAEDRTPNTAIDDGFYLIGNPFDEPWHVSGLGVSQGTLFASVQHWNGMSYVPIMNDTPVAAGFFAEVEDAALPLTFTFTPNVNADDQQRNAPERFMAGFELSGEMFVTYDGNEIPVEVQDGAWVVFSDEATDGRDRFDATKLSPLSYYWTNVSILNQQGDDPVLRAVESRPIPQEPLTIPMSLSTYASGLDASGSFTIALAESSLGDGWQVSLTDLETGDVINLLTDSYTFSIENQPAIDADQRFEITFTPPTVSNDGDGETYVFGMEPIWPNPTVSTSQVAFTLATPDEISVEVFDVLGRRVGQIATGEHAAGRHVLPLNTHQLASGVYVVRLSAGAQTAVQRVTVAR